LANVQPSIKTVYTLRGGKVKRFFPFLAIFSLFFSFRPARSEKFAAFGEKRRETAFLAEFGLDAASDFRYLNNVATKRNGFVGRVAVEFVEENGRICEPEGRERGVKIEKERN
jgi:hypothetical protein